WKWSAMMHKWQIAEFFLLIWISFYTVIGQVRYSIPEEMERGFLVGNIIKDIGLNIKDLEDRKLRVIVGSKKQYFDVNLGTGNLHVSERIDREDVCGDSSACVIDFEIVVENPLNLYRVEVEIKDVNDNPPTFAKTKQQLEMSESTLPGARFRLNYAQDPDVGLNSLQNYHLSDNEHFILQTQTGSDGSKFMDLVLEKQLDREKQKEYLLTVTAIDGGVPVRSSSAQVHVNVLDSNDNFPVFPQSLYKLSLVENTVIGTLVLKVNATDIDEGSYGKVTYSFSKISERARQIFDIDSETGEIKVTGNLDFEEAAFYEMEIRAKDSGGLTVYCKVLLEVIDVNDNPPEITVKSFTSRIPEDAFPGTVIALLNVDDHDSGENGKVICSIPENLPFTLKSSLYNYYTLTSNRTMNREQISEYNITITARDKGVPPLTASKSVLLKISDINDNPPVFNQTSYTAYVNENNPPGSFICSVKATDLDWNQNARLTYSITETRIHGKPVFSYVSINPENGNIQALRSFDHERFRDLQIQVKAQDAGSPPLSNNVTVNVFILDQNDNAPEILYPPQRNNASAIELAPRSAVPGYLVTKVVAVDADSGQNAWLSYKLLKAAEPNSFLVGLHTGEIRTTRLFVENDVVKQTLAILVKDNGRPTLSATVTLNILVADNFPEILPDLDRLSTDKDHNSSLTFYLVISLASVSFLFLGFIIVLMIVKVRHWRSSRLFHSMNTKGTPYFPPCYSEADGFRTLPQTYSYEVHLTTNSNKNEFDFFKPSKQSAFEINSSDDIVQTELQRHVHDHNNIRLECISSFL
uniref:Cadherin domain-containing protein n=1 Tax=Latimeria chalumnae TaxID=7897 RepID=H3ABH6_LATCH